MLPKDPMMLLSYVNTKLRDFYEDFDSLCDDLDADRDEITDRLKAAGFTYDKNRNQFI